MTTAELIAKIRAEVERRIKIQDDWAVRKVLPGRDLAFAVKEELNQLLSFLDTLEEPKFDLDKLREVSVPLSEEEKEAHRKLMDERRKKYKEMGMLKEQEPEVDFQFALDKYIGNLDETLSKAGCTYEFDWDDITETIREAARHFYELGKGDRDTIFHKGMMYYRKQMMEEAVEGRVYDFRRIKEIGYSSAKIEFDKIPELDDGDKVRIIIVKED